MEESLESAEFCFFEERHHDALQLIHTAIVDAYAGLLAVYTLELPGTRSLVHLRSKAECLDKSLILAWSQQDPTGDLRFGSLKLVNEGTETIQDNALSIEEVYMLYDDAYALRRLVEASCARHCRDLRQASVRPRG